MLKVAFFYIQNGLSTFLLFTWYDNQFLCFWRHPLTFKGLKITAWVALKDSMTSSNLHRVMLPFPHLKIFVWPPTTFLMFLDKITTFTFFLQDFLNINVIKKNSRKNISYSTKFDTYWKRRTRIVTFQRIFGTLKQWKKSCHLLAKSTNVVIGPISERLFNMYKLN